MPKIRYQSKAFRDPALAVINQVNAILREYTAMGYDLTLRQLYYQFVARGYIANKQAEYNRLGNIVNDGRMAGLIDWNHIVDRTRNLRNLPHWRDPSHAIDDWTRRYFGINLWQNQNYYVECWVEKDALLGVIERTCNDLDMPFFSCRGYTSQTEMWLAGQRLVKKIAEGKQVRILHLGDHDPSGIDMTRDIEDRLCLFIGAHGYLGDTGLSIGDSISQFYIDRLALNMDQIEQYNPPPNPAKLTDSRAVGYIAIHGDESWELDALPPDVLDDVIRTGAEPYINQEQWDKDVAREDAYKRDLRAVSERWEEVAAFVKGGPNG